MDPLQARQGYKHRGGVGKCQGGVKAGGGENGADHGAKEGGAASVAEVGVKREGRKGVQTAMNSHPAPGRQAAQRNRT